MTPRTDRRRPRLPVALAAVVLLATFGTSVGHAQECPPGLEGAWTGTLPADQLLSLRLRIRELSDGALAAEIQSADGREVAPVWMDHDHLRWQAIGVPLAFDGVVSPDGAAIGGFLYYGTRVIHVRLPLERGPGPRAWSVSWTPLGVPVAAPRFDLYIGDDGAGGLGGYFFFRDQRLPNLWGWGLSCGGDSLVLHERVLGLDFVGHLDRAAHRLHMVAATAAGSAPITFAPMADDEVPTLPDAPVAPPRPATDAGYRGDAPPAFGDGWPTVRPTEAGIDTAPIAAMVRAIASGALPLTHSVLVAKGGRIAVEEYFYGFDRDTWHDMRSASKTVASTLIGLAIRDGHVEGTSARALSFFPRYRRYAAWDPRKARITVRDLLTMSSGLDADDSDPRSVASEAAYQSQVAQPDWIKLALDAPMKRDPGTQPVYSGANPLILGGILAAAMNEPIEWYAHRTLFEPLGIEQYSFGIDPVGIVYMGGGLYLRPRDMLKYGQLYLDGGVWRGTRILPDAWVRESWGRYGKLAPLDRNGHDYGYLWWHHHYDVGGRTIETVEARGNGGQYIFVVPSLDVVVVITAGNYRAGLQMTRQPEEIMRRYVLPAVVGAGG